MLLYRDLPRVLDVRTETRQEDVLLAMRDLPQVPRARNKHFTPYC